MIAERKNPATLMEAVRYFDSETARRYVESIKWPEGPFCTACGSTNVGTIKTRGVKQCRDCRKQVSLTKGTIMEGTHLPLDQWCLAVWMIANCKNGVSSCEIARSIGCKQQSAWHLLHRVRYLLQQDDHKLSGFLEADATYIGGLLKFMSYERQQRAKAKGNKQNKTTVHAVKERRTGHVRARILTDEIRHPSKDFIADTVERGSTVYTDAGHEYVWLRHCPDYTHSSVNHTAMEYVRGQVHVNGLECFFNCLRRGLRGTYIKATPEHLQAYVDEQTWRFNHRKLTDWERFSRVMGLIVGKRLTYEHLTDGAKR
jgi:hypothetical protein